MRIVVKGALLLALLPGLPSLASAQSRYETDQPGYRTQQDGDSVVDSGAGSGRSVTLPKGWIRDDDNNGQDGDSAGNPGDDGGTAYQGDTAGTVEGDSGGTYQEQYGETAGSGDDRTGDRYGDAAGSGSDGDADPDRYGATAGIGRGQVINCYINRRGREICH